MSQNNKPYILGVDTNAIIGTDKLLMSLDFSATAAPSDDINYIAIIYSEPFTYTVEEFGDEFNKELWYDNYYYTNRYSQKKSNCVINIKQKIDSRYKMVDDVLNASPHSKIYTNACICIYF